MAFSAAMAAALATNELLESILTNLDIRDLIACQRTCRRWRTVIDASTYMQQTLFLRPKVPIEWLEINDGKFYRPRFHSSQFGEAEMIAEANPAFGGHHHGPYFFIRSCWSLHWDSLQRADERMFITQPPCRLRCAVTANYVFINGSKVVDAARAFVLGNQALWQTFSIILERFG